MNKRVSWDYMISTYPGKWIAFKDPEMDGPDVVSGVIVEVLSDDDIIEFENAHYNEDMMYRRTKNGVSNGPIRANFVVETS